MNLKKNSDDYQTNEITENYNKKSKNQSFKQQEQVQINKMNDKSNISNTEQAQLQLVKDQYIQGIVKNMNL